MRLITIRWCKVSAAHLLRVSPGVLSRLLFWVLIGVLPLSNVAAAEQRLIQREDVQNYIREISRAHGLQQNRLAGLFADVTLQQSVIDRISRPAERVLQWHEYRKIFLTERRINEGRTFLQAHQAILNRAYERYGVPPELITAVIGVETFYGRLTGKDYALPALATLAFAYPPRASFFRKELTEFLLLSDEEGFDAATAKGSYAAAMGMPQFISSSYRAYAVDFDGDGKRDLWNSVEDVIGSVANYFARHGWRQGEAIAERVYPESAAWRSLVTDGLKPDLSASQLRGAGIGPRLVSSGKHSLYTLEQSRVTEAWVGHHNFYVITRYNHSRLYAMAVMQLAESIKKESAGS